MKVMLVASVIPLTLGGCGVPTRPVSAVEMSCMHQAVDDPAYKLLINKAIGNQLIQDNAVDQERSLKTSLTMDCLRRAGLAPPGGVEAPRIKPAVL